LEVQGFRGSEVQRFRGSGIQGSAQPLNPPRRGQSDRLKKLRKSEYRLRNIE
jgi:hypothetical protein